MNSDMVVLEHGEDAMEVIDVKSGKRTMPI